MVVGQTGVEGQTLGIPSEAGGGSGSESRSGAGKKKKCPPGFKLDPKTNQCVKIEDFGEDVSVVQDKRVGQTGAEGQTLAIPSKAPALERELTQREKETKGFEEPGEVGIFRDKSGRKSGIQLADGRVFLGISPDEVNEIAAREEEKKAIPEGAVDIREEGKIQQRERLMTIVAEKIGQIQLTGDVEQDKINYTEAFMSSFDELLIGAGTGVVAGALTGGSGGAVTGTVGAIIFGVGGAIVGYYKGVQSNVKAQRQDILKGEAQNLMKAEQNLLKTVMLVNQGGDPVTALNMFNEQLSLIDEYNAKLQLETTDDLSHWLGEDGHKQLEKYRMFNTPGGMREIVSAQMSLALIKPDPSRNEVLAKQIQDIPDIDGE